MATFMTVVGVLLIIYGFFANIFLMLFGFIFIFLGWVAGRMSPPPQRGSSTSDASVPDYPPTPSRPTSGCGVCLLATLAFVLLCVVLQAIK